MKIFVYGKSFLSGMHWWLQSFAMYVQLMVAIVYICTHKVIGSHRSLLTLFSFQHFCTWVHTFPSKWLQLHQNNYWTNKGLIIHSVQNYLSKSSCFALSYRSASIHEASTSKFGWRFAWFFTFLALSMHRYILYVHIISALIIIIPRKLLWSLENENEGPSFVPALKTVSFSSIPSEEDLSSK